MPSIFSFLGDLLHLLSIVILLTKIYKFKNCQGISLKTQFLYALVFVTRYLDLFYNFTSMYKWIMKIIFITSSCTIVYLMKYKEPYCRSYDPKTDNFPLVYVLLPSAVLALLINNEFTFVEILWTFSIYLEAVAIMPQLMVVHAWAKANGGFVENLTSDYVFTLGGYRAMYLLSWISRYMSEPGYRNWIVWIAGVVQTLIYCDFFYYYVKGKLEGKRVALPV
eukprot:TRINITY_DN1800_c0_g1_i5.p1 TRINITY_DN1800_c0_g1~~TRINITY_DN1800_c0_g1_i5.p1  ORF type:complete len:222 (+),score=62.48 TRINITY_DN1800_c0_g1_i5:49-714(+)